MMQMERAAEKHRSLPRPAPESLAGIGLERQAAPLLGSSFAKPQAQYAAPRAAALLQRVPIATLQRSLGNRALARLLQRAPTSAGGHETFVPAIQRKVGDGHDLSAPRFTQPARDEDLEACYDDEARLTLGEMGLPGTKKINSGAGVKKVQAALTELGLLAAGFDTGVYTPETWEAVKKLKKANNLGWETMGDVGPGTMDWLDKHFAAAQPTCPPCPEEPRTPGCPPCAAPEPKPAPQPRANCSSDEAAKVADALSQANTDLSTALNALDKPSALRDNVLWVAFRSTGESDIPAIRKVLTAVQGGLPGAKIECSDPGILLICTSPETVAHTNTFTGTMYLCRSHIPALGPRVLVHEGCHAFAGLNAGGELYLEDNCGEGDVAGQSRAYRLQNADSFACFVQLLAHAAGTDLEKRVQHSKGADLAVRQKPTGNVSLGGPEGTPTFSLVGFSDVGIKGIRWILKDDAGRHYLLRKGDEVIEPDRDVDWVSDIIIGAKTRALLRERGIQKAQLFAVSRIPEADEKAAELDVTFAP
jgi:Putative peptidoglycan binding domain